MFEDISYSNDVLLFHTSGSVNQAGAVTTLRHASLASTSETVTLGKHGPFSLPEAVRGNKEFQRIVAISPDPTVRVAGKSKTPHSRPDWPVITYAYRLYADHEG